MIRCRPTPTARRTGLEVLATAPARLLSITPTYSEVPKALWADPRSARRSRGCGRRSVRIRVRPENIARIAHNHAVIGTFTRGKGGCSTLGRTDWCYGLDRDPLVQQVTRNILRWLTAGD